MRYQTGFAKAPQGQAVETELPMDSKTIRQAFLDYFARHDHQVVRSSALVPAGDPTLYFTNAGMVQFKDVFIGAEKREYSRATSTQKCLRVSGKHNDLENVGRTARHHTFFEMLGNFSFGDYFKSEAIRHAWTFLTDDMGLDADRMVATVFAGEDGVPADEEAYGLWKQEADLPEARIQRLGKSDNFWAMGDTGPCGPCSELHYHQGDQIPCPEPECLGVACECDRWIEIWNLVFMQYSRDAAGVLSPLAATGVDTGMGLERLVAVKQGVLSTYDTDLIRPLIGFVSELSGKPYGQQEEWDVSLRVVADHARATAFCIADGVFPEKGGREYVLRRIMRRAIRHGDSHLGLDELFFNKVCLQVVEQMGHAFPELHDRAEVIDTIVQAEETGFRRTLTRGLQKLQEGIVQAREAGEAGLLEAFVGNLYSTHGFPIDLTRTIAEESGLTVDEQRAHAWITENQGASGTKVGDEAVAPIFKAILERVGPTEFVGYEAEEVEAEVLALVQQGEEVEEVSSDQEVSVMLSRTPLYGRSGGQVGDTGTLTWGGGAWIEVTDTLKPGGRLVVHQGKVIAGNLRRGEVVQAAVDKVRRQAIHLNHSATHLLHHALRRTLGDHVAQKGSEVAPLQLRFDFSHFEAMTAEQLRRVEVLVNAEIRRDLPSRTKEMPFEAAQKEGAMALFGEKYGDEVRVVRIGTESVELCGGTHVGRAGEIGLFKIVSEEALALGVRRIVAQTGDGALTRVQEVAGQLRAAANLLRCGADQVEERINKLQRQIKDQDRQLEQLKQKLATGGGTDLIMDRVQEVQGIKLLATSVGEADPKTLRQAGDELRNRLGSGVVVLGATHKGKAALLVMVSKDLIDRVHAGKIVGQLAKEIGGRGGGRPDMAQAGGPDVDQLEQALAKAETLI
jgi:alanyl-tRNA synthetase